MATLYRIPQYRTTTIAVPGNINASQTTGIIIADLPADLDVNVAGILALTWSNPVDEDAIEYITYTSINSGTKELQGVTRGQEGFSARAHNNGATVAWVVSKSHINNVVDKLTGTDTTLASDTNGNELIKTSTTTSAVNEFTVKNAATGNGPELQATGGDTNIPIVLQPKGTGAVVVKGTADSAAELRLNEDTDNGTNYIGLKAPASVGTSKTFILPDADGSSGQFLKTDGSATLSWGTGLGSTTQYYATPTLLNGQIVPSVAANDLTVALKGMDGNDPSASNPVYVRLGNTVRTITSALSVTTNDGTNWFNAGSAEHATKEIDYFVYLGYNATDGVVIGFSRIPYAKEYDDFSTTSTNERYCAISTITNAAAGDDYEVIGRFAATLSAGAGYTWTVPTFTNKNLIQQPIYHTRWLSWVPVGSASGSMGFTVTSVQIARYAIQGHTIFLEFGVVGTTSGTASNVIYFTLPLAADTDLSGAADSGVPAVVTSTGTRGIGFAVFYTAAKIGFVKGDASNFGIGADCRGYGHFLYEI